MKVLLARVTLFTVAILLASSTISKGDGVPATVQYFDHDKVAEMFVKGGNLVKDPGLIVAAGRRGTGQVEYHDKTSHIFIIVEGECTLLAGGTMVDPKRTAPDQMRAENVEGATTYHLTKGDVLTVPPKTPHWFKEIPTKTLAYYAINIDTP
jgi:mannose-6-phosphate isomerase-like protein (cupin superfamily)